MKIYNKINLINHNKNYFMTKIFLYDTIGIDKDDVQNIVLFGNFNNKNIDYIYENIIKYNKNSSLNIVKKNINNTIKNKSKKYNLMQLNDFINSTDNYTYIFLLIEDNTKELYSNLVLSWDKLNHNGKIIIEIKKYDDLNIQLFKNQYENEIKSLNKIGKYIIIHKNTLSQIKKNISNGIPKNITLFVDNYIDTFPEKFVIILPKMKKEKINWEFTLTDNMPKIEKKVDISKEIDKLGAFKMDRFDINSFIILRETFYYELIENIIEIYKNIFTLDKNKGMEQKIRNVINVLNFDQDNKVIKHIDNLIKNIKNFCINNNEIIVFELVTSKTVFFILNKLSLIDKKIKLKQNIHIDYPLNPNSKNNNNFKISTRNINLNNKIEHKYLLSNNNLMDFDNIVSICENYKNQHNVDFISIRQHMNIKNMPSKISINHHINLWIPTLYLILSIQKENGNLLISDICNINEPFIQFINILNNFYDKVEITNDINIRHHNSMYILCSGFRGITKSELNEFRNKYSKIYNKIKKYNFYSNNQKEKIPYISSICKNKVSKDIENKIKNFNIRLYNDIENNVKNKIKLNELYDLSNNDVKKYIFEKIFEKQYLNYIKHNEYIDDIYNDFVKKCTEKTNIANF